MPTQGRALNELRLKVLAGNFFIAKLPPLAGIFQTLVGHNEADTRAKLIDPKIKDRGWTEEHIRREESAGRIVIIEREGEVISKALAKLRAQK